MIRDCIAGVVLVVLIALPLATVSAEDFNPLPAIAPIPADNSMTQAKVELGKMLFFDPRLSGSDWISCATCHNPALAFADRIPRSLGHKMSEGPRNTPTVLNAAFLKVQFWDGRAATLEEQALGPIQASVEMNASLEEVVKQLKTIPEYVERFNTVFGKDDSLTPQNIAKAIAAFERTLITPDSSFDHYLAGDKQAISVEAKKGAELAQAKGCLDCHSGPVYSDGDFHHIKVPGSTDLGRYTVTKKEADKYAFRTPSLRNVALTKPYMNNGSVASLEEAVKIMGKEALGEELSDTEIKQMTAFLNSLTGTMPQMSYPILP
jgi:cytochrome c peroxidase